MVLERPAVALDHAVVGKHQVRREVGVGAGVQRVDFADAQWPCRAVRAFGGDDCAGLPLQQPGERRVVAMRVADEDMADRPAVDGAEQSRQMIGVVRAGIDDRQAVPADDVAVGAVEGERAGIVDGQPPDSRRDLDRFAIMWFKPGVEVHNLIST